MSTPRLTAKLQTVYDTLLATGVRGATLPELVAALAGHGLTRKAVHQHVSRLRKKDLVEQRKVRGPYFALEPMDAQSFDSLRKRGLEIVADCPHGVSDEVLAQEIDLTPAEVWRLLEGEVKRGGLLRVRMPQAHGGGKGFAAGMGAAAAAAAAKPATPAAPAGPAADTAAAPEALGAFELLEQSRLAIAWSGARVVLPAEVTRGLFRYLDALGGLQISRHLQSEQAGAP